MEENKIEIVVIDDNLADIEKISRLLSKISSDYTVTSFTEADRGLDYCKKNKINCVLVDFQIPGSDGFEIINKLNEYNQNIPVIMLTAQGNESIATKAMKLGAFDYIVKSQVSGRAIATSIKHAIQDSIYAKNVSKHSMELKRKAMTDPLTGLYNRNYLFDNLSKLLISRKSSPASYAILFIDLDKFKIINDTYGHEFGDKVLINIAERILECLRSSDYAIRLGGDEFIIVLNNLTSKKNALIAASRIHKNLQKPIKIKYTFLKVDSSIGIVVDDGTSFTEVGEVIKKADLAMYEAKRGKRGIQLFDNTLKQNIDKEIRLEEDLRLAIESNEIQLEYQPIITDPSEKIFFVEAYCIWNHPKYGLVDARNLIHIAEGKYLSKELNEYLINKALKSLKLWEETYKVPILINISGFELENDELPNILKKYLSEYKLSPCSLILEITEERIIADKTKISTKILKNIDKLKKMGFQIAIDDFNNLYSPLEFLANVPIDILKVDKSLIDDLISTPKGKVIIQVLLSLAQKLNISTIIKNLENIKNDKVQKFLSKYYYIDNKNFSLGKKISFEGLIKFLAEKYKP